MIINEFRNEYRWLSNFWPCDITIVGIPYKSVEAAYQASKTNDLDTRRGFSTVEPARAKAMGRGLTMRDGWGDMLKVECMELCLRAKFGIPELRRRLISTVGCELTEGNTWNDRFWGVSHGSGRNILGKLLMMLRDEYVLYDPLEPVCAPRAFDNHDDIPF